MEKKHFVALVMFVVGGLLFSLGMCMCLLPEWDAFKEGVILGAVGGVTLLATVIATLKMLGVKMIKVSGKLVAKIIYAVISLLVFGTGMCLIMAFDMMLVGILVGIVGIVMLLCLIPMFLGFR